MSVTTTANARMVATRHYLADYELHHSQPENPISAPAPNEQKPLSENNPPGWEDQWRRVPAYRPAQNQLDEQRTTYTSEVERNFVRVMFGGVSMMASASQIWRATGGRINSDFFKHKVGGEW
ncbi:hypothetical protein WHR41_09074 [Cladosporium halotolerans]|uniref:Uncharacterized protein n=1 Tax=Cladosporium halotolerans TaxID=1052096 RepID=A0AB34KBB5_9PEZI